MLLKFFHILRELNKQQTNNFQGLLNAFRSDFKNNCIIIIIIINRYKCECELIRRASDVRPCMQWSNATQSLIFPFDLAKFTFLPITPSARSACYLLRPPIGTRSIRGPIINLFGLALFCNG